MVNENTHTIVYRPPNFKLRCFGLVFFVWLFSALLIISVIFSSLIIGKLITEAMNMKAFVSTLLKSEAPILSNFSADLMSIFLGLKIELFSLKYWKPRKNNRWQNPEENNAEPLEADQFADGAENNNGLFVDLIPWMGRGTIFPLAVYTLSSFVWALWIVSVHKLCIDLVAKSYDGILDPSEIYGEQFTDFLITKETMLFHFLAGFVTVVPFVICFTVDLRIGNLNRITWSECFKRSGLPDVLMNFIGLHGSAVVIRLLATMFPDTLGVFNTIWVWALLLAIFTAAKALVFLRQFYHSISDQVRNERYVRGRAIINDNDD
jgi:E3 ubiquitin-protein ligase MARCH6